MRLKLKTLELVSQMGLTVWPSKLLNNIQTSSCFKISKKFLNLQMRDIVHPPGRIFLHLTTKEEPQSRCLPPHRQHQVNPSSIWYPSIERLAAVTNHLKIICINNSSCSLPATLSSLTTTSSSSSKTLYTHAPIPPRGTALKGMAVVPCFRTRTHPCRILNKKTLHLLIPPLLSMEAAAATRKTLPR